MFLNKLRQLHLRNRLFWRIAAVAALGITAIFALSAVAALLLYKKNERQFAESKLLQYWATERLGITSAPVEARRLRAAYMSDIITAPKEYALRVVFEGSRETLFVYPDSWMRYDLSGVLSAPVRGIKPVYRVEVPRSLAGKSLASKAGGSARLTVYSVFAGSYTIQVLLDDAHFRASMFFFKKTAPVIMLLMLLLSVGLSYAVFMTVLNPVYQINRLAEHIIKSQNITRRLPAHGRGGFTALERNINEMLDTIERLVTRLKDANADLGHDIRTPLTHIRNNLEEMHRTCVDEKMRAGLQACMEAVDALQKFAKQVLDRAEIEAGLVTIPETPENVARVLENVIDMYEYVADAKGVHFTHEVDPAAAVFVHSVRLSQLVGNLLDNACKFTPAGKRVVLSVKAADGFTVIQVADEGAGIAEEDIPRMWDMFWKKGASADAHGGSGFGLTIVKGIVTAYRGSIDVVSQQGQGTVFTVRF